MSENETSTGLNRRSVVKGAAWSVPVIAAAIAAPAASASHNPNHGGPRADLTPAFGGSQILEIGVGGLLNANVTLANTLTISNIGDRASTGGETVLVSYPETLGSGVTLIPANGSLATVALAPNGFLITLPAIPVGGAQTFNIGLVSLPVGILGGTQTIIATVNAADANQGNNTATTDVGITLLNILG